MQAPRDCIFLRVETEILLLEARTWRMQRLIETAVHRQIPPTDPSPTLIPDTWRG